MFRHLSCPCHVYTEFSLKEITKIANKFLSLISKGPGPIRPVPIPREVGFRENLSGLLSYLTRPDSPIRTFSPGIALDDIDIFEEEVRVDMFPTVLPTSGPSPLLVWIGQIFTNATIRVYWRIKTIRNSE